MSNNKQSSVEWLFDELARINFEYATNKITPRDFQEQKEKIKQQAKAIHKQEMLKFAIECMFNSNANFIQKYNETFGENKPEE